MAPGLLLVVALAAIGSQEADEPTSPPVERVFVVIVNADHAGTAIPREQLADVFLRRVERWGDGRPIEAADQSLRSAVREAFSRQVLRLEPGAVLQYWQSQLQRGTGLRPPLVKSSDAEVVDWVGQAVGRIGYVNAGAELSAQVKAVSILE